jgi:alanyl-tRNA synthetase
MAFAQSQSLLNKRFDKNGVQCLVEQVEGDANQLKLMVETLKNLAPEAFILLGAQDQDKLSFVAYASSKAIAQGLKAGDVVKAVASYTGGNGGGRPDFAQSGGKDIHKLEEALNLYR